MKELLLEFKRVGAIIKAKCKDCGCTTDCANSPDCPDICPRCPTCQRAREIAEWEYHEITHVWISETERITYAEAKVRHEAGKTPNMFYDMKKRHGGIECSCGESHMDRKFASMNDPKRVMKNIELRNPHFDIALIKQTLKELGLWKRFLSWHWGNCYVKWTSFNIPDLFAEILTDEELLQQATLSFLREVECDDK